MNPRFFVSALAAASIFLIFPRYNFWVWGYFLFVPLLTLTSENSSSVKQIFWTGFFSAWVGYSAVFYWLIPTFLAAKVSIVWGGFAVTILSAYLSIYTACFFAGLNYCSRVLSERWIPLFGLCLWVVLEYARASWFSGFPWMLLGYSQVHFLPAIQIAEWTGVYGVSALLISANIFFANWLRLKKFHIASALPFILLLATSIFLGQRQKYLDRNSAALTANSTTNPMTNPMTNPTMNVAVLQGNIDQYKKWDHAFVREILLRYRTLSTQVSPKAELVIWPESALPGWVPNDRDLMQWIQNTIELSPRYHLIGAVTQAAAPSSAPDQKANYNSAFLFDAQGAVVQRYDKTHLVPFGEYVPVKKWLEKWLPILGALGGFESGKSFEPLRFNDKKIAATICYESIFPELVRQQVAHGAQLLVNLTNDGWYLQTAAPEQHFSMNILRAVENRRDLVRAANTGISGVIRADGSVAFQTKIYEQTQFEQTVRLRENQTVYTRHGDIFAKICGLIVVLFGMIVILTEKKIENAKRVDIRIK